MHSTVILEKDQLGYNRAHFEQIAGLGLLTIGLSANGSYLAFKRPLSVVWRGRTGGDVDYFVTLPYSREYRQTISASIPDILYDDFTDHPDLACLALAPLLALVDNGLYTISFFSGDKKDFIKRYSGSDPLPEAVIVLESTSATDRSEQQAYIDSCSEAQKFSQGNPRAIERTLLDYSTGVILKFSQDIFVATVPKESFDESRDTKYVEEIREGKRPFAIVFVREYFHPESSEDWDSPYYVIDGHHKLLAYHRLGIHPPVLLIRNRVDNLANIRFDANGLKQLLFPWQYEHLIRP